MPQSSTISIGMYVHLEIPSAGRALGKVRGDGVKSSFCMVYACRKRQAWG